MLSRSSLYGDNIKCIDKLVLKNRANYKEALEEQEQADGNGNPGENSSNEEEEDNDDFNTPLQDNKGNRFNQITTFNNHS